LIQRNIYIVLLAILFFGVEKALNWKDLWGLFGAPHFWALAGLPQPYGYLTQGFIFLILLFVLQNGLFDPYLKMIEEREAQTTGKRQRAEKIKEEAKQMIEKYQQAIEEARLRATKERELRGLQADEEEQKQLKAAKEKAQEVYLTSLTQTEREAKLASETLEGSLQSLASVIVTTVMEGQANSGQIRASGRG